MFKSTNNLNYYSQFSKLRALCKIRSKSDYNSYITYIQSHFSQKPKSFWNYFNSLNKNKNIPLVMDYNNIQKSNGCDIAELFKNYFSSVYSNVTIDPNNLNTHLPDMLDLPNIQFSLSEIFLRLDGLKSNPSPSLDGVPEIVLKSCKYALTVPICIILNRSLTSGIFP